MTIEELVERKTSLRETLEALHMCNVHSKTFKELVSMNLREAETRKELSDIERKITDYIEGRENDL